MFSNEMNFLALYERHQDRLRQAEHNRMIRALEAHTAGPAWPQQAVTWLGSGLVRLGARLEHYGTASPATPVKTRLMR